MMRADAIVVGSGLAGQMTAIDLDNMRVLLLTRDGVGDSASSTWAQGGVAAALGDDDSPELHAGDTVSAGAGLANARLAQELASEAPAAIERMIAIGARLDRRQDGSLAMGREAAHSRRRIVHAQGDATGRELVRAATSALRRAHHVEVRSHTTVCDLLLDENGRVCGVRFVDARDELHEAFASRVILATGGLGALYRCTTNPPGQWGAGISIAARAGALLSDLEFVQFHPTALDVGLDPMPLITEAVRGEGAQLVDARGDRIMEGIDARLELAPRDVVARRVYEIVRSGQRVYLDARPVGPGFAERFPGVFAACLAAGIDPRNEPMPVAPAAHYHMGGIAVDPNGRTTTAGLWACGEVSATGVHGANRLASNSLLEALVFARRVARDAASAGGAPPLTPLAQPPMLPFSRGDEGGDIATIRATMFADVGIERTESRLRAAVSVFWEGAERARSQRLRDMSTVGALLAEAAEQRRESRGSHYRLDYPTTDASARRSFSRLEAALALA